jgi:hypothetical protein
MEVPGWELIVPMTRRIATVVLGVLLSGQLALPSLATDATHQWRVELWIGGDDGLTQRFADALKAELQRSADFTSTKVANTAFDVKMLIPSHVKWAKTERGVTVFPVVIFIGADGRFLEASTPECMEASLNVCAGRVLSDARVALRDPDGA